MKKLGICCDVFDEETFEKDVREVKNIGFDKVFIGDYGQAYFDRRIKLVREAGLEIETIHARFHGINSIWLDGPEGDEMIGYLKGSVDKCKKYSIPVCIVHLSSGWTPPTVSDLGLRRIDDLVEYAKSKKIMLAFENLRVLSHLMVVLEKYKNEKTVGFCYDCGHEHCYAEGVDVLSLFGKQLVCVHLHDNHGRPANDGIDGDEHLFPFEGTVDYTKVMSNLKKYDLQNSIMLELGKETNEEKRKDYVKRAYEAAVKLRALDIYRDNMKENIKKIAIIGAGMMGSALAFPARENGHEVRLVGTPLDKEIIENGKRTGQHPKFDKPFPDGIVYYQFEDWKKAVDGVDFVIGGVSSFGVDWFLENILLQLDPYIPVLSVTKGLIDLEDGTLISYPEYWERELKKKGIEREICAIGGPCTSYELVYHDQTEVAFCGRDTEALKMMKKAMTTEYYHISLTTDMRGLESAVALKNGYALGIALTIGLCEREHGKECGLHYNSQAGVFYQAVREMKRLLRMQNSTEDCEAIGVGDLYVTVYGGRTRQVGILLGRGMSRVEAVAALNGVTLESLVVSGRVARAVRKQAGKGRLKLADFPLLMHVDDVLTKGTDAQLPWEKFTFQNI